MFIVNFQGTARPTKYHVLYDDAQMPESTLEEITYYLCHLFTRCTRSVSIPAPTYYAHLAAFRIRAYIERWVDPVSNEVYYFTISAENADLKGTKIVKNLSVWYDASIFWFYVRKGVFVLS